MSKIGIVSHDAGGAEVLSNWVKNQLENHKFNFYLEGPAKKIFRKNLNSYYLNNNKISIQEFINISDYIICSTSWASEIEKKFVKETKLMKKKVISVLDHWSNYRERFIYKNDQIILPDEIWVCDDYAHNIVKEIFNNIKIIKIKNPYFSKIKKQLDNFSKIANIETKKYLLYVCEPLREHALIQHNDENYFGYTEETALNYFLEHVKLLDLKYDYILIRPHPSENSKKYDWVIHKFRDINIKINNKRDLLEQIYYSQAIIGCESMALIVGDLAKKKIISSIPPGGRECVLPHRKIEKLKNIILKKKYD